jgi:hypothetical protein
VPIPECRQPERSIEPGVFRVAHPEARRLEEADDGRDHLLTREATPAKVLADPTPDSRQRQPKGDEPLELAPVATRAEASVVAVLAAAARVASGRLEVARRVRTDPDLVPRWRNCERLDPGKLTR